MARLHVLFIFLSGLLFILSPLFSVAQERCGTVEYEKIRRTKIPTLETAQQFEQWMQDKLNNKLKTFQAERTQASTYIIPVVMHVIHNGEAVGTGTNIPDAQIISQIDVLNKDYNRLNADAVNTPPEFVPFAGKIDIQFVLAQQDPEGLATNGITRTLGTKTLWALSDNSEFKALNYWPAENYLNIWVINLGGSFIGYAQLPLSTQLPGLEDSSNDRLTDGVIINYKDIGVGNFNLDAQYNKGRTATHEIGHFFGLRHIWGDGANCATDYVDDTPGQPSSTTGCPSIPQNVTCPSDVHHKMFQNYLDYTNDACMNLFTQGQVARMNVIIQNSPRRVSLLTSPGANPPAPVANDLGIRRIITPASAQCNNPFTPQIEVRNYGNNTINSTQVQLSVNGSVVETKTYSSLNLVVDQITILSFSALNFTTLSSNLVSFQILQTNGGTDGKPGNNAASVQVTVPTSVTLPIVEPFNSLPPGWQVINPDNSITWVNIVAPDNNPSNRAMYMNFNNYQNLGALDWLVTPAFTIANPSSSQLRFDLAYARFPGENGDELKVYALPGCNPDISQAILLYDKSGAALATAPDNSSSFAPTSDAQWRKSEVISLSSLTGTSMWQVAFVAKSGFGNNLYLDNAIISDQQINDVALTGIVRPGLVQCETNPAIQISIKNFSTSSVTNFQVQRILNGGSAVLQNFTNILLNVGEQKIFTLNPVTLMTGTNQVTVTITNPNGLADSTPSNNILAFTIYLDQTADETPLRLTFDNPVETPWLMASPTSSKTWELTSTNKNLSVVYKAFSNTTLNEEAWLVSPVLDMSRYAKTSLFFDVSYALKIPADDRLKILGSDDCGLTYKVVLFDRAGSQFNTASSTTDWKPVTATDWKREYVNLDTLAGKKNIRLAFVATNAHGNNLYLDNIELFAGDETNPAITPLPYQLYYSDRATQYNLALTFNLPARKDVRLQIFSIMGQIVADNLLPATLNQTYYFDLSTQSTGIYLFRLQIDNQVTTTKVYIGH